MTEITKERRGAIRAAAEKATPGPWEATVAYGNSEDDVWVQITAPDCDAVVAKFPEDTNDIPHIANCDPQTILAILDALDAAEAKMGEPVAGPLGFADPDTFDDARFLVSVKQVGHYSEPVYAAPPAAEPVAVKPLEWEELTSPREDGPPEPTGDWEASSIIGCYHVYIFEDHYEVTHGDGDYVESWCGDAEEAKAAAQADYEARILSALYAAPPAAEPAIPEGWVLVPREPTEAMLGAGSTSRPYMEEGGRDEWVDRNTEDTWSAMLAAAPTLTTSPEPSHE